MAILDALRGTSTHVPMIRGLEVANALAADIGPVGDLFKLVPELEASV